MIFIDTGLKYIIDTGLLKYTIVFTVETLKTLNDLFYFLLYFDMNLMMALLWFVVSRISGSV